MRHLAAELIEIPGVVAVALGGSRATGTETVTSDWDFGLYYRGTIDTDEIRRLGWTGQVFEPGQWGRIVNGGAWLEVDGQRVDLIYRNLDDVEHWVAQSERGRFEIQREVGYVAGIATYVLTGELAANDVLAGDLPRPAFPDMLRATAPPVWNRLAGGAIHFARAHGRRDDPIAATANLCQAVLAVAQARLAAAGEWALNEKGIIERSGLGAARDVIHSGDGDAIARIAELLAVEWM